MVQRGQEMFHVKHGCPMGGARPLAGLSASAGCFLGLHAVWLLRSDLFHVKQRCGSSSESGIRTATGRNSLQCGWADFPLPGRSDCR